MGLIDFLDMGLGLGVACLYFSPSFCLDLDFQPPERETEREIPFSMESPVSFSAGEFIIVLAWPGHRYIHT